MRIGNKCVKKTEDKKMKQKNGKSNAKWAGLTPPLLAGAALRAFFASNEKMGSNVFLKSCSKTYSVVLPRSV